MSHSKSEIVTELQRVFKYYGKPFSRREFTEASDFPTRTIERTFGGWSKAIGAAKLNGKFEKYKAVSDNKEKFDPAKELESKWKEERQELLRKAENKQSKDFKIKAHKIDLLKEMVEEAASKVIVPTTIKAATLKSPKSKLKDSVTLWFEFSDLQLGTKMTSIEMGGLNEHNWDIWLLKLERWKTAVIKKISAYDESSNVDCIILACLGDMVEGQDIFAGQGWQIDRTVVDQALQGAMDCATAFAEILLTFPHLKFHILEVFGNHGRIGRKGENPYANSMDKVFQRFLQNRLLAMREITNLKYHENEAWFYFTSLYGWHHLLLHGDQGMSSLWSNRPTVNGLEKGVVRYNQMLQQQVHFVHCGHFHNDWQLSMNMSQLLINGSFIGTSNFSAAKMVASSPPVQTLHVFEPRVGLARTERIHLNEGDIKKPVDPRSILA